MPGADYYRATQGWSTVTAVRTRWYTAQPMKQRPTVLCIGGHDPTGGAGIQADIETVNALGARALTLVTALTAQNTSNIKAIHATPKDDFSQQLETLIDDIAPNAIKIGLIGSVEQVTSIAKQLPPTPVPVVLDPVLAAGGGFDFERDGLVAAIRNMLLPLTTLITPNRAEARRLSGLDNTDAAADALLDTGAGAVLITGADEAEGPKVHNRLYSAGADPLEFEWPLLPHVYHGSGCTLASACATLLALGTPLTDAVSRAQDFVFKSLEAAERPGRGQHLPRRIR